MSESHSLLALSANELLGLLESRQISATELTRGCLDRIAEQDEQLGAFLRVDAESALEQAEDIDRRRGAGKAVGQLGGLPVAVKDILCQRGQVTTCGSRMLEGFRPPYNATVIERLQAADAVLIGRTNLDEFAMGGSTENSAFQPTRNPWNIERTPGGSSGGAAACVAARMVPLSIGTDTGGSIRQPAAFCGVVGMKPTYGRVSRYGLVAFASSLDQIGPLGRTVEDAALLLEVIAGKDPRDSTCLDTPVPPYSQTVTEPLKQLRVGVVRQHLSAGLDEEVAAATQAAINVLASCGAEIREVELPHSKYAVATYYVIAPSEASSNLARYDGVHYGYRTNEHVMLEELKEERRRIEQREDKAGLEDLDTPLVRMYRRTRAEGFGDEVKRRIMLGTFALSAGYYDAYYLKALQVRRLIRQDFDRAFEHVDLILGPVTAQPAFKLGDKVNDPLAMYLIDLYTVSANLAGIPGISVPCGFTSDQLPIGLQLLAPPLAEERLLRGAAMFQRATDWHLRSPELSRVSPIVHARKLMEAPYQTIIGLEVHVQLATASKLFCRCSTRFGQQPNTQTCPVCIGLPGSLPVMNAEAVRLARETAVALDCRIPPFTKWDRKQYYYPDLPKGYQISQYDLPLSENGHLHIEDPQGRFAAKDVGIIRAHLEEDAGKSIHDEAAGRGDSRIDLNRTGTPLLEIVSAPDMNSPLEARTFLDELKLLLTYLGVSDCNMQEGSLRVDANVNLEVSAGSRPVYTPIVEIKNMNSFRAVERALAYEAERHYREWQETGATKGDVPKQTRGWDDGAGITRALRSKEESSDYRYFPDPDLVPITTTAAEAEQIRKSLAEFPATLRRRLQEEDGLSYYDADVLVNQGRGVVDYYRTVASTGGDTKLAANWVTQDVLRVLNDRDQTIETISVPAEQLGGMIARLKSGELLGSRAKDVFALMVARALAVEEALRELGIEQVDEGEIERLCRKLLDRNPKIVADIRGGNLKAAGALIGQAKKQNPNVDPTQVRAVCLRIIEASDA